jgi:hypothetical protein
MSKAAQPRGPTRLTQGHIKDFTGNFILQQTAGITVLHKSTILYLTAIACRMFGKKSTLSLSVSSPTEIHDKATALPCGEAHNIVCLLHEMQENLESEILTAALQFHVTSFAERRLAKAFRELEGLSFKGLSKAPLPIITKWNSEYLKICMNRSSSKWPQLKRTRFQAAPRSIVNCQLEMGTPRSAQTCHILFDLVPNYLRLVLCDHHRASFHGLPWRGLI